jgi:acyl carrier protein
MELETFIQNFADQFMDPDADVFTADTDFHKLSGWSSLTALLEMAMIEEQYGITLTGNDIRNTPTLRALFDIIQSRK